MVLTVPQTDISSMQRIAITGSSGYYGSRLIEFIRQVAPQVTILGLDVTSPRKIAPHEFTAIDIRDPQLKNSLANFQPDTVVHLAFVVNPIHDEDRMHDININGSRNVFEAVQTIRPERLLVASSASAFGPWPDNPLPIDDRWPMKEHPAFRYAHDKFLLERMVAEFADRHSLMQVSWTRPCVIYGPGVDNYLSRIQLQYPAVVLPDGVDVPQQFVHEEDLVAATWCILEKGGRGPYNLGPPDWIRLSDVARETGRRTISVPLWMMNLTSKICWGLRLSLMPFPPALNLYIRYPWIVAPRRLSQELGFQFKYTSLETLRNLIEFRSRQDRRPPTLAARHRPTGADAESRRRCNVRQDVVSR